MKQNLKKILLFLILFLTLTSCKDKNLDVSIQEEQSDLNELFTQEQINEIEDSSIQIEPSKNEKLDEIRKKLALKGLITKGDMYFNDKEYITALAQYLKVLKEVPNDKETNLKIGNVYYNLKRFSKAYEYYAKIKDYVNLDKKQAIYALVDGLYEGGLNLSYINNEIDSFGFDIQEIFYYKNSLICINNFSKCRANFEEYFKALEEKQEEITMPDLATIKETFTNYKNFQLEDLTYKAALVTGGFYKNGFYFVSLKTGEEILKQNENYKPVLKIVAKSAYELGSYEIAKNYLITYNKLEVNDAETSYFLGRIYEKLGDKILSTVHLTRAIQLGYEDINDIKRRLIFVYYELNDTRKMLKTFKELLDSKDKKLNINDYNLAIYYHIVNDDLETAQKYSQEGIKTFPDSELFYGYYAWILLQKEDLDEEQLKVIRDNINKALEINKENAMIAMVEGIYNLKIKQPNKAIIAFKNANLLDKSKEYTEEINYWLNQISKGN